MSYSEYLRCIEAVSTSIHVDEAHDIASVDQWELADFQDILDIQHA